MRPEDRDITVFAIDLDHTWTRDINLFLEITKMIRKMGYEVVIATGRKRFTPDMLKFGIPEEIQIFFCGDELKSVVLDLHFDSCTHIIWIDDMPGTIEHPRILAGNPDKEL